MCFQTGTEDARSPTVNSRVKLTISYENELERMTSLNICHLTKLVNEIRYLKVKLGEDCVDKVSMLIPVAGRLL